MKNSAMIIAAFAMGVGIINIMRFHLLNVRDKREKYWYLSPVVIGVTLLVLGLGIPLGEAHEWYQLAFDWVFTKPSWGSGAISGYFVVGALYYHVILRGRRDWEAGVLLFWIVMTLFGRAPFGGALYPGFVDFADWTADVWMVGGSRSWTIAMATGVVALAVRAMLGKEPRVVGAT
jgi:hypothetical protein